MFQRVLLPLDGSHAAERAIPVAACIARSLRSEIRLVDVLPSGGDVGAIRSAFMYLNRIARQVALTGLCVGTQVRTGSIADGVLSAIELLSADLLVMASCFGEVRPIALRTRVPVVLVPPQIHRSAKIERVLVPVDRSLSRTQTVAVASELAHRTGAELILLRVVTPNPRLDAEAVRGARHHATGVARRLEGNHVDTVPVTVATDLGKDIVEASKELAADIVVVGTREFVGWLPLSFIDAVGVPVLLVPDALESTLSHTRVGLPGHSDARDCAWRQVCDV